MNLSEATLLLRTLANGAAPSPGQVGLTRADGCAQITISNPTARNAMTVSMMAQLAEAVETLQNAKDGLVVVKGEGGHFCSGGHLQEVQRHLLETKRGQDMSLAMTAVLDALFQLPCVTVAAVAGYAVGGGAELAMSCDFRVFHPSAHIHFVHGRLGIVPGWGATHRLVNVVGRKGALQILAEARSMSAGEARAYGLVDFIVEGEWPSAVYGFLSQRFVEAAQVLRAAKTQVISANRYGRSGDESRAFAALWGSEVHRQALKRALQGKDEP